jgi:hypothetical protein
MYTMSFVTGSVLILKNMPCILFSDKQEEPHPVPPPRLKKKSKVASIKNITQFDKSADKRMPHIRPKQRNDSKAFTENTVIMNDCCYTDDANEVNSVTGIVMAGESATGVVSDMAVNSNGFSHTVWKREQPNYHNINEREVDEFNNVCGRSEGCGQNDSGVYLSKAVPSVKTERNNGLIRTEHDFRSSVTQDGSSYVICLNCLLDNSHKVYGNCEVVTGLPKNYTSCLSVTNDPEHLLNEALTCLYNTHLGQAFPPVLDNSHILIESVEEAVEDTVNRMCRCADYEESLCVLYTGNSHVCVNSTVSYSVCSSDGTVDVFHERDEGISIKALSENNTVSEFWLPEESVHADTVLENAAAGTVLECMPADRELEILHAGTKLESVPADRGVEFVHADRALEYVREDRGLKPVPAVRELDSVPTDRELESVPADRGLESVLADRTLESVTAGTAFQSMAADRALGSSLSLSMNQCNFNHFNHGTEENTFIRQSGLGLLSCCEELNVSLIKSDTAVVKPWSTDISVVNDLINATSRNNSTNAASRVLHKRTVYDKDYCLYSALENFGAVSNIENKDKQWINSDSVKMINWEHSGCKSNNKSHVGSGEIHPNKISKTFRLFIKDMLMDNEECDLSYHGDNTDGSVTFKCAFNLSEDVSCTEKTNKRFRCLDSNMEELTKLPVHSKASPRCITVEPPLKSGVLCDIVNIGSEYCNQHECPSKNSCVVPVVSMNTTVPSCDESCQPSLHGKHQLSLTLNCCINTINSEESTEYVSFSDQGVEVSVMKCGEDTIETNTEESFTALKKSNTLPSSGSRDVINKSYNNSYSQTAVGSKTTFVEKIKDEPVSKSAVNEECLDGLGIKMDKNSG